MKYLSTFPVPANIIGGFPKAKHPWRAISWLYFFSTLEDFIKKGKGADVMDVRSS